MYYILTCVMNTLQNLPSNKTSCLCMPISEPRSFEPVIYLYFVLQVLKDHNKFSLYKSHTLPQHAITIKRFSGSATLTNLWTTRYIPGNLAGSPEFDLSYPETHGASVQSHLLQPAESVKDVLINQRHNNFKKCFSETNPNKVKVT